MKNYVKRFTRKPFRIAVYGIAAASIPLGIAEGWWDERTAFLLLPILLAVLHLSPDDVD